MKLLINSLIVGTCLLATAPASAWGEREQGALLGLVLGGIVANIYRDSQPPQIYHPPVVIQPQPPVYVYPAPQVYSYHPRCYSVPAYYDRWGRVVQYQQVCR
jgi:hypothetical protein